MYMEIEIWKQVVGYEDTYAVSNFGNVKRMPSECIVKRSVNCISNNVTKANLRNLRQSKRRNRTVELATTRSL